MEGKDFWKVFRWKQRNGHQRQTLFLFWNVTNHGTLRVIANRLAAQFGWPYKVRWTRPLNILRILATTLNERSWEHARRTFHACIITLHSKTPSSLFEKRTHTSPQLPAGRFYRTEPTLLRLVCCYFLVIVGCCRLLLTDCDNFPRTLAATATPFFAYGRNETCQCHLVLANLGWRKWREWRRWRWRKSCAAIRRILWQQRRGFFRFWCSSPSKWMSVLRVVV